MNTVYQPRELIVFFDSHCPMCVRGAAWLAKQPCYFPLKLISMHSAEVRERYPSIAEETEKGTFVALDDRGGVYF